MRLASVLALFVLGLAPACGQKQEVIEPSGPPPLPPASGTPIGYLIDAKGDLALRDDQLGELQKLDTSLAAENGSIDAQLRQIEKPMPGQELTPQQQKAGEKPQRYNNAPGASTMTTSDSEKLRRLHDDNEQRALAKALAILDTDQAEKAKRILQDRGVKVPGQKEPDLRQGSDSGTPLPGM
jgi:hypothetical protein